MTALMEYLSWFESQSTVSLYGCVIPTDSSDKIVSDENEQSYK